jgi:DNA-binding transcriptional ArsR family regulator
MDVETGVEAAAARLASAIGEPARARMLFALVDDRARTSTELAMIAEVSPSTASAHLNRLKADGLVVLTAQGKHRYYRLRDETIARALEALSVAAGCAHPRFAPSTPVELRTARSCYDHIAGSLGVALHGALVARQWCVPAPEDDTTLQITAEGERQLSALGIDPERLRSSRRRTAFACLDWSERRPHLGGALGAALLELALERGWVARDLDSRALEITDTGRRAFQRWFEVTV